MSKKHRADSESESALEELLKNPWSKILGALTATTAILGVGIKVGDFNRDVSCRMEKIEMQQQFNEQLQKNSDECRELKLSQYSKSVNDLEEVVKELKKNKHEK